MIQTRFRARAVLALILAGFLLPATAGAQAPPAPPRTAQPTPAPTTAPPAPSPDPAPASSPEVQEIRRNLDAARHTIETTEAAARDPELTNDDLAELRTRIDPVTDKLRDLINELGPKLDAARVRLEQLGPKPKEGTTAEGQDVARDRTEREAAVGELDEVLKLARALLVQSEQLTSQISDRRRSSFTKALFQRSYSILSPNLWLSAARSFPRDLRALRILGEDAWWRFELRSSPAAHGLLALALGIGIGLHLVRRRLVPRLVVRDPTMAGVGPKRKLFGAAGVLFVETLPAVLASLVVYYALVVLDMLPLRLVPFAGTLLGGIAFLAFVWALIDAIFAPSRPAWRLVELPDAATGTLLGLGTTVATVVVAGRVMDALNQAIAAGLPLSIAVKAITAVIAAAVLAALLYGLSREETRPEEACLGPYIPQGSTVAGPIRLGGWLLVALVLGATLAGYVAFASFLLDQILWVGSLAGILFLLLDVCERFIGGTLRDDSRVSTVLQTNLGLRRKALQQLGIVASGIARLVLWIVAAMLALAPWGIESADLASSFRAAFFGFKVGDVTISLSTTIAALGLFAAVVAFARLVQRWLSGTLLPTTELDAGLRNSITTAAGYLGFFVAAALAFGYLGLSLEKIAIVAGALSVGIGFGLQSIVNNFVSGLILLWERPIRVGDLVVVGDSEGYVRRISVRATEIETFDRSSVIVPNSNLISGTVKNRMREDVTGRVVLPVNVLRSQDPARAADLLVSEAASHPDVMKEPPPRVLFRKIGDTWLEFELICFVGDVTKQARVQSDLNFTIFRALVREGILPPLGGASTHVDGLEPVQSALQQIADAIGSRDRSRAGPPPEAAPKLVRRSGSDG